MALPRYQVGSDFSDTFFGFAGFENYIFGQGGDDFLFGDNLTDFLYGGDGNDELVGFGGNDELYGGNGDDFLEGRAGADVLSGGAGTDLVYYLNATSLVRLNLITGGTTGDALGDTYDSIENVVDSNFSDVIFGNDANNTFFSFNGSDYIHGGNGRDTYVADYVFDTVAPVGWVIVIGASAASVASIYGVTGVTGGTGSGAAFAYGGGTTIYGVDALRSIENLTGTNLNDRIYGDDTDNVIDGGLGADLIVGGGGNDTVTYASSAIAVQVNLASSADNAGGALGDGLNSIENVIGTDAADTISGNGVANVLTGRAGNDLLVGLGGNDTLFGGNGSDTLAGGTGNDILDGGNDADVLDGGAGIDTASWATSDVHVHVDLLRGGAFGGATGDFLVNIENLTGSHYDGDRLVGNNAANVLIGNAGDDVLLGCDGDDILYGGLGPGADGILSAAECECVLDDASGIPPESTDNDFLRGDLGNDKIYGQDGNDLLLGCHGNDELYGGANADILIGGDGNDLLNGGSNFDVLIGGAGIDTASYAGSAGAVRVDLTQFWTNGGGDASGDVLALLSDITTTLDTSLLWANVVATGSIALLEDALGLTTPLGIPDVLIGIESLAGSSFSDTLTGDAGANTLTGGIGADRLRGNGGNDVFRFNATNEGGDVILDFNAGDKIALLKTGFGIAGSTVPVVFGTAPVPTTTAGTLLFNNTTDQLIWDSNGTGAGGTTVLATLVGVNAFSAADVILV